MYPNLPKERQHEDHWHKDRASVLELANHLVDECWLTTPEQVVRFFEKPQKWTKEYLQFQAYGVVEEVHND